LFQWLESRSCGSSVPVTRTFAHFSGRDQPALSTSRFLQPTRRSRTSSPGPGKSFARSSPMAVGEGAEWLLGIDRLAARWSSRPKSRYEEICGGAYRGDQHRRRRRLESANLAGRSSVRSCRDRFANVAPRPRVLTSPAAWRRRERAVVGHLGLRVFIAQPKARAVFLVRGPIHSGLEFGGGGNSPAEAEFVSSSKAS